MLINYCDSFRTYETLSDVQARYSIYGNVGVSTISGTPWLYTQSGSIRFNTPSQHWQSFSFDFVIDNVSSYPFYICALAQGNGNSASVVSGSYIIRVNADRSITFVTADNNRLTSTNDPSAVIGWSSASGIVNISGGSNRLAFNVNMADRNDNKLWINGNEYYDLVMPVNTPLSGEGFILGCPLGQAKVSYQNLIYRTKTTGEGPLVPALTNSWNVGLIRVTSDGPYATPSRWTVSGAANATQAVTSINMNDYLYNATAGLNADVFRFETTTNPVIEGVQTNFMHYSPSGGSIFAISSTQDSFEAGYSSYIATSSTYGYHHYRFTPNFNLRWNNKILNDLSVTVASL